MSYGPFADFEAIALAMADDLCGRPDGPAKGNPPVVARLVADVIRENFRIEEEINREAERALAGLGTSTAGMDKQKLVAGLRERIAKKKGFVL
jgi:hypothetical protein